MDADTYQEAAGLTAYPYTTAAERFGDETQVGYIRLAYVTMGLVGEAGEVAGIIKKVLRDNDGNVTPQTQEKLAYELGDCLWYLANACSELGLSLSTVMQMNADKLTDRAERGALGGSGDAR